MWSVVTYKPGGSVSFPSVIAPPVLPIALEMRLIYPSSLVGRKYARYRCCPGHRGCWTRYLSAVTLEGIFGSESRVAD